jgi:hypothetical protein
MTRDAATTDSLSGDVGDALKWIPDVTALIGSNMCFNLGSQQFTR